MVSSVYSVPELLSTTKLNQPSCACTFCVLYLLLLKGFYVLTYRDPVVLGRILPEQQSTQQDHQQQICYWKCQFLGGKSNSSLLVFRHVCMETGHRFCDLGTGVGRAS